MGGASHASGLEDKSTGRSYEVMMVSMGMSISSHLTHVVTALGGFGPDHTVPSTPRPLTGTSLTYFLTFPF